MMHVRSHSQMSSWFNLFRLSISRTGPVPCYSPHPAYATSALSIHHSQFLIRCSLAFSLLASNHSHIRLPSALMTAVTDSDGFSWFNSFRFFFFSLFFWYGSMQYSINQTIFHLRFREFFNSSWEFSNKILCSCVCYFLQLPLSLTKLCHIKSDHLVNFCISLHF